MKSNRWLSALIAVSVFFCFSTSPAAEEAEWTRYESPKGSYRIQQSVDNEAETPFVVSTKNPAERAACHEQARETKGSEQDKGSR